MWTEYENSSVTGTSISAREGAALASADTVTLTDFYHQVTGATPVNNFEFNGNVTGIHVIRPTGAFPIGTGGNISGAPATATVDALMLFLNDGDAFRYIGGAADTGAATSVLGRSVNSSGIRGNIAATANNTMLRRVEDVLGFGDMPTYNPEDFAGATPRLKIQAAIDAAEAAGGGRVAFTRDYTVSTTDGHADATQAVSIIIDDSNIVFDGQGHTLTFATGAINRMFIIRNTADVTLCNLNMVNTASGTVDSLLCIQDSSRVTVTRCSFWAPDFGVSITEDTSLRGDLTSGSPIVANVRNISRWAVGHQIAGNGIGNGSTTVTISAIDTVARTMTMQSGGVAHNATVTDADTILFHRTSGGCNDVTISECYFKDCGTNGVQQFPKAASYNIRIIGNTFHNSGLVAAEGSAIKCGQATYNSLVANNTIRGGRTAIAAVNYHSVLVVGNIIQDVAGYALGAGLSEHADYAADYGSALFVGNIASWTGVPDVAARGIDLNGGTFISGATITNGPVVFRGNAFFRPNIGFLLRPLAAITGVVLDNNLFYNQQTVSTADAASGGAPSGLFLTNNITRNTDSTKTVTWRIEGNAISPTITGNHFYGCAASSLRYDASDVLITDNRFIEGNPAGAGSAAAIHALTAADVVTSRIYRNTLDNRSTSPGYAYLIENSTATATTIINRGNIVPAGTTELRTSSRSADHASIRLTAQAAAIGSTVLMTAPPAGVYRINFFHEITRAATTSSATQLTIGSTSAAAQTDLGTNLNTNVLGAKSADSITIEVVSGDITYSTSYASVGATTMQYRLSINVERLYT